MRIRLLSGPTALIELGGLRLLTDPTFDPPGDYPIGERRLTKLGHSAVGVDQLGPIDAVLLSHDQHPDNLDRAGRELLGRVPVVLSTAAARGRLGDRVQALASWETVRLGPLEVTGLPARHGPEGSEALVGEVRGFALRGEGLPAVYVSGDNASLELVREIAARLGRFDVAVLFAGGARTALLDGAYLTLPSEAAAEAASILEATHVVPVHFEGWAHFSQGPESLREAFRRAGLEARLHLLQPGQEVELP